MSPLLMSLISIVPLLEASSKPVEPLTTLVAVADVVVVIDAL